MTLTPRILIIPVVLAGLLVSAAVTAQPLAPQEILFVPWGDGADEVRYQQEPGGRFGPQSFRIGDDGSTVSLLDPLAQQLKTFTDGRLIAGTEIPTGCRDFLNASSDETYFLAGDQVLHARHGALVSRSGQTAGRPTIQGLVRRGDSLVALHHDGTFTELSPRTRTTTHPLTARAIRHSADLAEILFVQPDGTIDRSFDLPVASDNLGSLRVIGRDDAGRIFVDMHLVERAVPLAVRREVWVLSESGFLLGTLHLPTHYFTRLFRDLELTTDGDLYHLISAEDGLHVLKWSLQGIAGGGELGRYPAAFQTKVHYNNLQDDDPYARDLSDPGYTQQRATATRAEALATGETYAQHSWTATATNISNGVVMAPDGDLVETPEWIVIGLNDRIPYKWGGTDTLEEYDLGIAAGNYAGDIDTDGSSAYARGVDCSGFVCRCWNTDQDYTTREMVDPAYGPITLPYSHWEDLLPGDAVHREGHVRMAVESFADGSILVVEAAGSATNWCVGYVTYMLADLEGYSPRYYVEMDGAPVFDTITSASVNGYWTDTTTWVGGVVPTCDDNVVIAAGDTVIVAEYDAACKDLSFGGNSAQIKMYSTSRLNVYGDFTLYSTSHCVFDEYWSSNDAKIRFTGSAVQTLRGWNPSSGSTSFRDVIVDKDGGRLTTDGTDMRLGIQNSLEIVNGRFELAAGDDLEGRWATSGNYTGSDLPNVIIHAGAEFDMLEGDGAHHMRSDYDSGVSTPIGVFTIYGSATFRDGSTIEINLSGIDIEAGGKLLTSTGMGSGQFDCGPLHIKPGGELENYTTSDCWGTSAVVTLDEGGLFDTKASVTVFPANFTNNGTVRYSREGTIDQAIVDMDYKRLEISLDEDSNKNWLLGGNRVIADTLRINYDATLVLTADDEQSLTVGSVLWLSSGLIDNSDGDVRLTIPDGGMIQRATGTLTDAPEFAGVVDLRYTANSTQVTTGPEVPATVGLIDDFEVAGDAPVDLGRDITVGGICAATDADLNTGAYTVTLGPLASLAESPGMTVVGTVAVSRTVAQSVNETFGDIGLELLAGGAAPGLTDVVRTTGTALDIDGTAGIQRFFTISPANNTGLDATVVLHYDESELNELAEHTIKLYESFDGGTVWNGPLGTVGETGNTITATQITSFALLTAGLDDGEVPVGQSDLPQRTALVSQYPNPFNPVTRIVFDLKAQGPVQIGVYDVRGQCVATLVSGIMDGGRHEVTWHGTDERGQAVASGVYFCRLQAGDQARTLKMVLAR